MVAKITTPKSLMRVLNYNEQKVKNGKATCIAAINYLQEPKKMSFYQKAFAFENLNTLNDRATTKTIHVSLNFHPSEKLSTDKLSEIAAVYMEKIGFIHQPCLVYEHHDAGHPHIHIVSTTIRSDGSRINTHNLGKDQSEKARKEIEQSFALITAKMEQQKIHAIKPIDVSSFVYGRTETKQSIAIVVDEVFNRYRFTSLPAFNAALKQFNVIADQGKEDGRIFKNNGLMYRLLDVYGNKAGVPIKASSLFTSPTLSRLTKKFDFNRTLIDGYKKGTQQQLEEVLENQPRDFMQLIKLLDERKIYTLLRKNDVGRIYGITFVDNNTKCVFNGSDLGKVFSAAGLQKVFAKNAEKNTPATPNNSSDKKENLNTGHSTKRILSTTDKSIRKESIIELMLLPNEQLDAIPFQLKKRKKKSRKNR